MRKIDIEKISCLPRINWLYCHAMFLAIFFSGCSKNNSFHGGTNFKSVVIDATADRVVIEPWSSDPEELSVVLHAGMDSSQDPCAADPVKYDKVATKLIPISYCLTGNAVKKSQKREFCLLSNSGDFQPARDDTCWQSEQEFENLALLSNGANELKLFIRDDRGNEARDGDGITLHMGNPPLIDFLAPTSGEAAEKKWTQSNLNSQPVLVRFKITDDDTKSDELKVILQLADPTDLTRTFALGCNFTNSPKWRQCPLDSTTPDSRIQLNSATGEFSMQFLVPASWDVSKPFIVLVTAIDQSGNASIASTQELNAGWEVIAGRTYKGIGGSGVTIQNDPSIKRRIISDKRGIIYLPSERLKIDPFDVRTCRMFRTQAELPTFQDCRDIIVSNWQPLGDYWVYDRKENAFYSKARESTAGRRYGLVKIDFQAGTITELTSASGKSDLNRVDLIDPSTEADQPNVKKISDYSADAFVDAMAWSLHDEGLLLKVKSMLVVMKRDGQLQFLAGQDEAVNKPEEIDDALAHEIVVPSGNFRFGASGDGRYLIGGEKLTTIEGSAFGAQYMLERFDSPDGERWRLLRLSDNPSILSTPENYFLNGIAFDPNSDTFYASIAWTAIAKMALPPKRSQKDAWQWTTLLKRDSQPSISEFLINDEASSDPIPLQRRLVEFRSHDIAVAGPDLLYVSDSQIGFTFALDLKSGRASRITGFAVGTEPTQLALNRRLDTPRRIAGVIDDKLFFGDYFGIHRVNIQGPAENRLIELFATQDTAPIAIDSVNRKIIRQYSSDKLEVISIDNRNETFQVRSSPPGGLPLNYTLQGTLQFLNNSLFQYHWRSDWDSVTVKRSHHIAGILPPLSNQAWNDRDITTASAWKSLSHPDRLRVNYDGPASGSCTESGCPQGSIDGAGKIDAANYRGAHRTGQLNWRSALGSPAFISPTVIFGCQATDQRNNTQFSLTDTRGIAVASSGASLRFIDVTYNSEQLPCSDVLTQFVLFDSSVFFNTSDGVYEISAGNLLSALNATGTQRPTVVATKTALATGWNFPSRPDRYFGLYVNQRHIYFSETTSDRVIRVLRATQN